MEKNLDNSTPHEWQPGDLGEYEYDGERIRVIRLTAGTSNWINENGVAGFINLAVHPVKFLGKTEMPYMYSGNSAAEVDFEKGLFNKYFK